jgi:hypothetical protein
MNSLVRICNTSDFRGLSKAEKVIKLVEKGHGGVRESLTATGISAPTYYRAKIAREEERKIGVAGRPKVLGDEREALLIVTIDEAREKKEPLNYQQIREKINSSRNILHTFKQFSLNKHLSKKLF